MYTCIRVHIAYTHVCAPVLCLIWSVIICLHYLNEFSLMVRKAAKCEEFVAEFFSLFLQSFFCYIISIFNLYSRYFNIYKFCDPKLIYVNLVFYHNTTSNNNKLATAISFYCWWILVDKWKWTSFVLIFCLFLCVIGADLGMSE